MPEITPYKTVLENLSTAILLLDAELKIYYLNPACENLFSTSEQRLRGKLAVEVFLDGQLSEQILYKTLNTGRAFTRHEAEIKIAGKSIIKTDYSVTLLPAITPNPLLLIEFRPLENLLKISKKENFLAQQQANKTLIRSIAHEVKNPLGGIRGAAQLLAGMFSDADLNEYTDVIIDEVDRLHHLVDELLGPPTEPRRESVNMHEVLERVRQLILAEAELKINFLCDYDISLPNVIADENQLIQCTLNIVRNAYQALTENPEQLNPMITLRTRIKRQMILGGQRYKLALQIDIEDNGPGIETQLLKSIFYPMVSNRAAGNGLGLSIAQSIINQHHGLIECDSQPGLTVFSLTLPLEPYNENP